MTKKKRLTISFSKEELEVIEYFKKLLKTKQISTVIFYCLFYAHSHHIDE